MQAIQCFTVLGCLSQRQWETEVHIHPFMALTQTFLCYKVDKRLRETYFLEAEKEFAMVSGKQILYEYEIRGLQSEGNCL